MSVTDNAAWKALAAHQTPTLRELFAADPERGEHMVVEAAGLTLDYSKQRVTPETVELLAGLAQAVDLAGHREAMFSGQHINSTEDRAVLHTALRLPRDATLVVDGTDVVVQVHEVLDRMTEFSEKIRSGQWTGHTGRPIRNVVNIGIGGSDLGPVMAYEALKEHSRRDMTFRFVSNVDGTDFLEAVVDLDPEETLFIVSSKTFTTQETMNNAHSARAWLLAAAGDESAVAKHFVAVSTNAEAVSQFGIDTEQMFGFWDWVGGRYSMDSAIGLSTMLAIGPENYAELLAGFHEMDVHFRTAPLRENIPALMGLLSVWNRNFLDLPTCAVLPYEQYLKRFPAYLQQLTMESNGKSVRIDGSPVGCQTSAIFWGEPGTNGQHSFYQLMHQGTATVACDFLFFLDPVNALPAVDAPDHHDLLVANVLAQAAVLAFGKTAEEVAADGAPAELVAHKVMPGDRPSSMIVADRLDPRTLGRLVALYEHSVFAQGVIWGINPFDQWGVELGKVMAQKIAPLLTTGGSEQGLDSSTTTLARKYREHRGTPG